MTATASNCTVERAVRPTIECWAHASAFLTDLIGSPPDDLLWDSDHPLRGHGHVRGHELVVIASRDDRHDTIVLTADDWDAVRHAAAEQRRALLASCAIGDRHRLLAICGTRNTPLATAC